MKNIEKIKAMTAKEFARWCFTHYEHCEQVRNGLLASDCAKKKWIDGLSPCEQCLVKWLNAEATKE